MKSSSLSPAFKQQAKDFSKFAGKKVSKYGGGALRLPFKSISAFAATAGLVTLGAFFAKRFKDSYTGDAQRDFYRDDIYMKRYD